jgi:hypothetical protein
VRFSAKRLLAGRISAAQPASASASGSTTAERGIIRILDKVPEL